MTGPTCVSLDCCWAPDPLPTEAWQPDVYMPRCFYPNNAVSAYNLVDAGAGTIQQTGGQAADRRRTAATLRQVRRERQATRHALVAAMQLGVLHSPCQSVRPFSCVW